MAEREGGGSSGWLGFIAGIALLAVIAIGVVAYTGGFNRQQETAQLEIEAPDIDIDTPDIDLPNPPPAPSLPPAADTGAAPAEPAPATTP
jgi:hypothetical protein